MNKEIFIKYLNNSCSEAELSAFLIWLDSDQSDEILMDESKSEWQALSGSPVESGFEKCKLILDKIHLSINNSNNQNVDFIDEDEKLKNLTNNVTSNDESLYQISELMKSCTSTDDKILCRINKTTGLSQSNKL